MRACGGELHLFQAAERYFLLYLRRCARSPLLHVVPQQPNQQLFKGELPLKAARLHNT
jgi:hypothetical protein